MDYVIGVDLDNTIVSYDALIHKVALEMGLVSEGIKKVKRHIRDAVRQVHGDEKWQEVQAVIYGQRMGEAELIDGVERFFRLCKDNRVKVFIISHKTEFSNYFGGGSNFRKAALDWMERNNFFKEGGLAVSRADVHFESTREGKQIGRAHV